MGVYNAELFNNLGLCCFYAQQYDMTLTCFERALSLAEEVTLSEVWYNIGHVALVGHINTGSHNLNWIGPIYNEYTCMYSSKFNITVSYSKTIVALFFYSLI